MTKINLSIANASSVFSIRDVATIMTAAQDAQSYLIRQIDFDYDVDIVVTPPSLLMKTVPEDGIARRTYSSRLIMITLDKGQAEITRESVFETICHEMSHSLKWEKLPEYANSL